MVSDLQKHYKAKPRQEKMDLSISFLGEELKSKYEKANLVEKAMEMCTLSSICTCSTLLLSTAEHLAIVKHVSLPQSISESYYPFGTLLMWRV